LKLTPDEFIRINRTSFESPYEEYFVRRVLSKVPGLDLSKIECQTPFRCLGRDGRCDFTLNDQVRIAFEVDGYDKTGRGAGMTPSEFVDWHLREGCLKEQGWTVLRFANTQVRDGAGWCAQNIGLVLKNERAKAGGASLTDKETLELRRMNSERQLRLSQLEAEVARLGEQAATAKVEAQQWRAAGEDALKRSTQHRQEAERLSLSVSQAVSERDAVRKDRDHMSSRALIAVAIVAGLALLAVVFALRPGTPPEASFDPNDYIGQGNAFDCPTFKSQADAQAVLRADPTDPNRLDGLGNNQNGIACETLPEPFDRRVVSPR
jgi:very-short-patch-repair endonuclease